MTSDREPGPDDRADDRADERIVAAFDDLRQRAAAGFAADGGPGGALDDADPAFDPTVTPLPLGGGRGSGHGQRPGASRRRFGDRRRGVAAGVAAAAAAVAVAGAAGLWALTGDDDSQGVATGPGTTTAATAPDDGAPTSTADPATTVVDDQDGGDEAAPGGGERYRVDAAVVAADRSDPFLNVRQGPGAEQPLMAKLPPAYRSLRATGAEARTDDGATWIEVELLAPVALAPGVTPPEDSGPTGWVNRALLVALADGIAVGTDEVPACDPDRSIDPAAGPAGPDDAHVAAVESRLLTPTCLRVVVSFDAGPPPFAWEQVPATAGTGSAALPVITMQSAGFGGTTINLGVSSAWWPAVNSTEPGVYLVRASDGTLDLVVPAPGSAASITVLPDEARTVIDVTLSGAPAPPTGAGIVVTDQIGSDSSFDVAGLARPFEATVGVTVHDEQGEPVEAVFAGSDFLGTVRADSYGVSTNDWIDAWGRFAVRVTGLAPGPYTLILNGDGGSDNPEVLSIPFTITMTAPAITVPPADDQAAALGLVALARGGPIEGVPLADTVTVGLALADRRDTPRVDLADRSAWVFDVDGYEGYAGPIDVLAPLVGVGHQITAGPANHCASPPLDWPAEWDGLRHLVVQPIGIDSCLQWYGVNLFLDDAGQIRVVMLELWEP